MLHIRRSGMEVSAFGASEPDFPNKELTEKEVGSALNWYHYMVNESDPSFLVFDYLAKVEDPRHSVLKTVKKVYIPDYLAWYARLMLREFVLPEKVMVFFNQRIDEIIARYRSDPEEMSEVWDPRKDPQDRLLNKFYKVLGVIEGHLDDEAFSLKDYLTENDVSSAIAKKVVEYYEDELATYESDKVDPKHLPWLSRVVGDARGHAMGTGNVTSKPRKPRAKKEIPPSKKVATLKFATNFEPLNLVSVKPESIIGAQELYVFDSAYNILTRLVADGPNGLDVKGTTVIKVDEKASSAKVIGRHAKEVTQAVLTGSKVQARKVLENVKAKPSPLTGRINEKKILLKVFK